MSDESLVQQSAVFSKKDVLVLVAKDNEKEVHTCRGLYDSNLVSNCFSIDRTDVSNVLVDYPNHVDQVDKFTQERGIRDLNGLISLHAKFGTQHLKSVADGLPYWQVHDLDIKALALFMGICAMLLL